MYVIMGHNESKNFTILELGTCFNKMIKLTVKHMCIIELTWLLVHNLYASPISPGVSDGMANAQHKL